MSSNILLITADSLRADYCGFLDGPETTPYLSQLASESTVYDAAVSPGPRTPSSIALTHTGNRFRSADASSNEDRLARIGDHIQRFETIPERLSKKGYSTGAVTANPWTTGFNKGFDEFVAIGEGYSHESESSSRTTSQKVADYFNQWRKGTDWFAQWGSFYDEIQKLIESLPEPWFVWVFLMDTHSPYLAPRRHRVETNFATMYYSALRYNASVMRGQSVNQLPSHLDQYLKQSYRDAIRSVDAFVERIHDDVGNDTSLIFHSDHGEAFGEHGSYGHQDILYPENIHVPLLVHNEATNQRVDEPVSTLTIPSIAERLADGDFNAQDMTDTAAFSENGDGSLRAARTNSHWFIKDGGNILCQRTQRGPGFSTLRNERAASSVRDLFNWGFAGHDEKSRILSVIKDTTFSEI